MRLTDKALKAEFLTTCARLREGQLTLRTPEGQIHRFGSNGPEAEMAIKDWAVVSALASRGDVGLGEAYVEGLWETPSIEALVTLAMRNRSDLVAYERTGMLNGLKFRFMDSVLRAGSRRGARRNIRAHYDVGNEFYQLWLDDGMTYSSALFKSETEDLSQAQHNKNDRVLSRLGLGEQILEIGCGWGGFAEHAAQSGRHVTGITISQNQHAYSEARLDGRARIELQDYRDIRGRYDNIVSIEMIEAVGARYWPIYFAQIKRSLAEGGRALLQAITVPDAYFETYRTSSDYIRQYVFPGGMLLSDAVIADQARQAGLVVTNSFAFGQDYGRTCRIWASRLTEQRRHVAELGHGEGFFRNWRYYLESCAAAFAVGHTNVVQVELSHA